MDKIKIALIGAGKMANKVHYPSLASFDDVEIVGLCDLDGERLEATAAKFDIRATYADYGRMIDETNPDAVYALMPPHHLFDVAADVLQRNKHLFVEKPPGVSTLQAESLARLAEDAGLITAVGFQRRYHPLLRRCWEKVLEKGPVNQVVSSFYKNSPPNKCHPYFRGAIDILRCDAIHAVDALRYYCGLSEVVSVTSDVRKLDAWYANSFNAIVRFENGAVGVLQANWRTGRRFFRCEFHAGGALAFADTDAYGSVWIDNKDEPALYATCREAAGSDELYIAQGFLAENRAFVDAVRDGRQLHNSLRDSVKTMRLADQIYQEAANDE